MEKSTGTNAVQEPSEKISRRGFIKAGAAGLGAFVFGRKTAQASQVSQSGFNGRDKKTYSTPFDLVHVQGEDPYAMTIKAVESLGGMEVFVKKGTVVVIKPNIGWDRSPEQAANTNPLVVSALADMCFKAGAKRVNIFDNTCNNSARCYTNSGIKEAAEKAGAKIFFPDDWNIVEARFPYKSPMEGWPVFREAVECDTFINVPVLKHHGLTGLTLSMKNLMGVCSGRRGQMHYDIGRKLVDLTDFINPDLTVIDAYRVLMDNGPSGGSLSDVELKKTLLAGTDPTLADTYACGIVGKDPAQIPYIQTAFERGFGICEAAKARISRINL